jgi:hypothetical protein
MTEIEKGSKAGHEYLFFVPGRLSAITFPLLLGIVGLLIALVYNIHYPEVVNAKATIIEFDSAQNMVVAEMEVPDNRLFAVDVGQQVRMTAASDNNNGSTIFDGRVDYIYGITGSEKLKVRISLPAGAGRWKGALMSRESRQANARIIVRDVRMIQYIISASNHS